MLQNGLNIRKSSKPQSTTRVSRPNAFEADDSEPETNETLARPGQARSSLRRTEVDETDVIYDYDGLYDSMKVGEKQAALAKEEDKKLRKPKYMQNLFEMAEIRKQDRLRAEDTKLQREREAEGDEYADKEKFVTGAYRAQQEELRRVEAEEAEKEAKLRAQAGGFAAFNQSILANDTKKRDAAVLASFKADRSKDDSHPAEMERKTSDIEAIRRAEAKLGHKIALNDDNQVVDHRQLLTAGLNRPTKSVRHLESNGQTLQRRPVINNTEREERQAQIERQQRLVENQLQESRKREADEIRRRQEAVAFSAKRAKTDSDVSSARERYLARKAQLAAAATDAPESAKTSEIT